MKLCAGFVRSGDRAQGWKPCRRERIEGDKLCREHRDSLDGAVFGLFQSLEPIDERKAKREATRRSERLESLREAAERKRRRTTHR
jgi:hypothetical protein